jgi:hypothetical protein
MILYYRLMTKWSGLGDSTELSRVGLSQHVYTENGPQDPPVSRSEKAQAEAGHVGVDRPWRRPNRRLVG